MHYIIDSRSREIPRSESAGREMPTRKADTRTKVCEDPVALEPTVFVYQLL